MSSLGDAFQPPCGMCGAAWTPDHRCPTTPRIARSIDDLRVGQVVATHDGYATGNVVTVGTLPGMWAEYFGGQYKSFTVVILADAPPAADWLVPGEAIEALREWADEWQSRCSEWRENVPTSGELFDAARAVLDAAKEVGHE